MLGRLVIVTSLVARGVVPAGAPEPIHVGFLTALTVALAQPGKEMENGIQLLLQEQRFTIGGRPVQLTLLDTASNPSVALAKARELVEQRKVHVIIGPVAAFEAYAVAPFANPNRVPIISPSAAADDLTQRKATPLFVRATSTSSQPTQPLGTYAAKTLGYNVSAGTSRPRFRRVAGRNRGGPITSAPGKWADGERVADGPGVAVRRGNARGAKGPCYRQCLQQHGRQGRPDNGVPSVCRT